MASRDDSRVVFVGNIPYDGTEQQLAEQFSEVGTVVSFRLVNDRETGKPKGFGFCEYKDAETARSAIRNLNGTMFHGRALRVDTADDDQASTPAARPTSSSQAGSGLGGGGSNREKLGIDAIGQVVDSMPNEQQVEVLAQMKQLIESDPDGARRLLQENQQLAQAMLRLLIVFDAVKPEDIQSLSAVPMPVVQVPVQAPPQFAEVPMSMPYDAGPPPAGYHMMHRGPAPSSMMPPAGMPQVPPRVMGHAGPGPAPRPRRPVTSLPPQKAQLLQTIMSMTPEQFAALSPEMQQKVAILRSRIGARSGPGMMPRPGRGGPPPPRPY